MGKDLGFNSGVGHEGRVLSKLRQRRERKPPTPPYNRPIARADSERTRWWRDLRFATPIRTPGASLDKKNKGTTGEKPRIIPAGPSLALDHLKELFEAYLSLMLFRKHFSTCVPRITLSRVTHLSFQSGNKWPSVGTPGYLPLWSEGVPPNV